MAEQLQPTRTYKLRAEGPLATDRGVNIARRIADGPLRPGLDWLLRRKFTVKANDEVWQTYRDNWLNFAVRAFGEPFDRPRHIETLEPGAVTYRRKKELRSGVTKVTGSIERKPVTAFITPEGFVPFSLRTMDILPNSDSGEIPVSATLRRMSRQLRKEQHIPVIQMTAAGWNFMTLFSDAVYLSSLDEKPAEEHVPRHLRETMTSIDTRVDAQYFSLDDFFDVFYHYPRDVDITTKTPLLPGKDAHWLVTNKDGSVEVMSAQDIRAADGNREAFRKKIASITSMVGYVDDAIAQEPLGENPFLQMLNAVVLFSEHGEQRMGSIHAKIETNALTMFAITKELLTAAYPDAEDIKLCVVDGGGSSGAVVQKRKKWQKPGRQRFDTSTLPLKILTHEVPIYTAMVPKTYVQSRYAEKTTLED